MAQEPIMLGGRRFLPTTENDRTFDQYTWIQVAADKAGLGQELMKRLKPILDLSATQDEKLSEGDAEDLARSIVMRAYQERAHLDILAGCLVEVGLKWRYDDAVKNREFFANLMGEDIETIQMLMTQLVIAFFWSGLDSLATSPNSLTLQWDGEGVGAMGGENESDPESDSGSSEK